MDQNTKSMMEKRFIPIILVCLLMIVSTVSNVSAQGKSGKAAKGSKKTESIWKMQAQSVAKDLGLTKEKGSALEKAYIAVRQSQVKAIKSLPEESDRQKSRTAAETTNKAEREKFKSALKKLLSEEQIQRVTASLGTFNKNWDKYLETLQGFGLGKESMNAAQKILNEFVVEYEKAREKAVASEGRFSKKNSQIYKDKLDTGLSKILTAAQITQWKDATTKGKAPASSKDDSEGSGKGKKDKQSKEE